MTSPRSHLVDPEGGVYHVCSRCVRRAFLCGNDHLSGRDFDHRREWIVDRIKALSQILAVDIFGYAVMSNHYHLVLQVNSTETHNWTDDDIIERWLMLNPRKHETPISRSTRKSVLPANPEHLSKYRQQLGSLSWFMRYLNEPIVRRANQEDQCKGRFWEGRFQSQRLLDDHAVLTAMVYVDLNPLRAGIGIFQASCRLKLNFMPPDSLPSPGLNKLRLLLPSFGYLPSNAQGFVSWPLRIPLFFFPISPYLARCDVALVSQI